IPFFSRLEPESRQGFVGIWKEYRAAFVTDGMNENHQYRIMHALAPLTAVQVNEFTQAMPRYNEVFAVPNVPVEYSRVEMLRVLAPLAPAQREAFAAFWAENKNQFFINEMDEMSQAMITQELAPLEGKKRDTIACYIQGLFTPKIKPYNRIRLVE